MALKVVPAVYEDMGTLDIVESESYSTSPLDGLLFKPTPKGTNSSKARTERNVKEWKDSPTIQYFKVIDTTANDEIVAFAMYMLYTEDRVHLIKHLNGADVKTHFGDAANVEPASDFFGSLWAARAKLVGQQPHILIQKVSTSPKHQRRGAGSMLVKKACDIADELGILAALEASPMGLPLYKKFGFEEKERCIFEPRKYGRDVDPVVSVNMAREPVPKQA